MPDIEAKDGTRLHYDLHDFTDPWSDAPYVILQHGFARSARFWYNFVPYLARFYRVVCPDMRGFGRSSIDLHSKQHLTLDVLIEDLVTIVQDLDAGAVHYVGESFGGTIGFTLAATRPELVRSLCAIGATTYIGDAAKRTFAFGHASWSEAIGTMGAEAWTKAGNTGTRFPPDADPGLVEWYASEMAGSDPAAMAAVANVAEAMDVRHQLGRIAAPVLAVFASPTAGHVSEHETILRARVKNVAIVHMPTRYHMIQAIYPAACAKHLLHFLALNDGRACHE